jgi:hypothetical protein
MNMIAPNESFGPYVGKAVSARKWSGLIYGLLLGGGGESVEFLDELSDGSIGAAVLVVGNVSGDEPL